MVKINEDQLKSIVLESTIKAINELNLPNYKFKEFEKILLANGYSVGRNGKGNHIIYTKPGARPISVPFQHGGHGNLNSCLTAGIIKREGLNVNLEEDIAEFEDESMEPIEIGEFNDILERNGWHYYGYTTVSNPKGQTGVRYKIDKSSKDATPIEDVVKQIKDASKCPECVILSGGQNKYAPENKNVSIVLIDKPNSINENADYEGADLDYDTIKEEAWDIIMKMEEKGIPVSWKRVANALNFQINTLNDEDLETLKDAIEETMAEIDFENETNCDKPKSSPTFGHHLSGLPRMK